MTVNEEPPSKDGVRAQFRGRSARSCRYRCAAVAGGALQTVGPSLFLSRLSLAPRQIGTFFRILLLLRLGLRDLPDQLLGDDVADGIEVLRDRDERASAADDVVAIVVCKPPRGGWPGRFVGWPPELRHPP